MTSPGRLLVVHDDHDFAAFVVKVAADLGYAAAAAHTAKDFRALYRRHAPDVVVLDVILPETDGIELIQWLIAQGCRSRILVVSGANPMFATAAQRMASDQSQMQVTALTKPIPVATLRLLLSEPRAEPGQG